MTSHPTQKCPVKTYDRLSGNDTTCSLNEGHPEEWHTDGCLSWVDPKDAWEYIGSNEGPEQAMIWARREDTDPYGWTREILVEGESRHADELQIRITSNDRAVPHVALVSAPIEVVAEVLRRLGWTVTPPPTNRRETL